MAEKIHEPITITPHFYQLGTPSFPAYLSMGEEGMIIEGGTGPTYNIIVRQIDALGIDPKRIKYIALTHTHADHIGAVPHLRLIWPHLKVLASPVATKLLKRKEMVKEFLWIDRTIAEGMKAKKEITESPPTLEDYNFEVDIVVEEGDKIELGAGIVWTIYHTPGHAPCHISLYEEKEDTLVIGDTTGLYIPEKDVFWPNYFDSLERYCKSIKKLSTLPAKRVALSHWCVIEGEVRKHLEKALKATETYHQEILKRLGDGEDAEKIAHENAQWLSSLDDILPFKVQYNLCKLLIGRSQADAEKDNLFIIPKEH